jgi:hypothetical protein
MKKLAIGAVAGAMLFAGNAVAQETPVQKQAESKSVQTSDEPVMPSFWWW